MARDPIESLIVRHFEPVLIRYLAERGVVCYVSSDNFIYWEKGNNNACVAPDVYILPGILPTAHPRKLEGSNDEGCWKTWLLGGVVPNFALEVKAFKNPRKDELQAPANHDALGTKELIVFDPYWRRRRAPRKRFCVQRRNATGKLVIVAETNDDRVYSEVLEAFLVAQGNDETGLLRLGLGPNGDMILPLESERGEMEARRADEEALRADEEARLRQEQTQRADEEARLRQEQTRRADEEARLRQEQARRADEEARMRQEQTRRADEKARRVSELEAELARLRASINKPSKRSTKK
jgi:hypothetical protein